jgi:hypothetical protein
MSSPTTNTEVTLSATLTIAGNQVTVNTGDITQLSKNGFSFTLSAPVTLGSVQDFENWINSELQLNLPDLSGFTIPIPALNAAYQSFINGQISITTLVINTATSTYNIGVTFELKPPISILGLLEFDGIGVQVNHSAIGSPS